MVQCIKFILFLNGLDKNKFFAFFLIFFIFYDSSDGSLITFIRLITSFFILPYLMGFFNKNK